MPHVAFLTFGMLLEPRGHPLMRPFAEQGELVIGATPSFHGFVARLGPVLGAKPPGLAPAVVPQELRGVTDVYTYTLWRDLESVYVFAYYSNSYAEALRRRREWFVEGDWSNYVAWWTPEGTIPSWEDAIQRFDHLAANGSTPYAFDFKQAFGSDGRPIEIDRERVKEMRKVSVTSPVGASTSN